MPNLNGMELAKIINRFKVKPQIIFVSAHREYAHDAFEVEAFDYLLKPYSTDRITRLLRKIENKIKNMGEQAKNPKEGKITLNNGEKIIVLKTDDITFIRANERRTEVFFKNEKFSANIKFSDMEEKINSERFFKSHRSYLVNLDKIKEIDLWFNNTFLLTMENTNEKVPVSRSFVQKFKEVMNI